MRSFGKIKPSRSGDITLLFTDIGKSCPVRVFFTSQMCLLTLFEKIKFSRKFPNLQYHKRQNKKCHLQITNHSTTPCVSKVKVKQSNQLCLPHFDNSDTAPAIVRRVACNALSVKLQTKDKTIKNEL